MNYSLSEQLTGETWIDGTTPVYRRTISGIVLNTIDLSWSILKIEAAASDGGLTTAIESARAGNALEVWIAELQFSSHDTMYFTVEYIKTSL